MPDAEMVKVVLNGGSFGLLAIIVIWLLFKGGPMFVAAIDKLGEDHKATVSTIVVGQEKQAIENKEAVETLVKEHTAVVTAINKECREERRELAARLDRKP